MKRLNGMWGLVGLTVVVVGYAVYDFKAEEKATEVKEKNAILLPWEVDTIQEFEIATSSAQQSVARVAKEKDQWKVVFPLMDLADSQEVTDFLEDLIKEKSVESITEPNGIQWEIFGLDQPKGKIIVRRASGEKVTFAISSKKNYQGDAFLRKDEDQEVLSVSSSWFARIDKVAKDFQDKRVLRRSTADLEKLSFKGKNGTYTLIQKDGKWVAEERSNWALDQNKVREVIGSLGGNLVASYVLEGREEKDLPATELQKYSFSKPVLSIDATFKDQTSWSSKFGQDKDKNYFVLARDSGEGVPERAPRAVVAELTSVEAEKFVNLSLDQLRNKSEPFDFPKEDIKKIELRTTLKSTDLELKGENWEVVTASNPQSKVDSTKVTGLITKLRDLRVTEFIDKKMALPGKPKVIALKNAAGQPVFELQLGELQKKKIDGEEKSVYVAKTNLIPDLITIEETAVSGLGLEDLVNGEKPQDGSPK